jgi:hypothetical protein
MPFSFRSLLNTVAKGALALGTLALGTLALGTLALGTLALGTVALGTSQVAHSQTKVSEAQKVPPLVWNQVVRVQEEDVKAENGEILTLQTFFYSNGSKITQPSRIQLRALPLDLEGVVLDQITPSPSPKVPQDLDYTPESPFHVRLKVLEGFAEVLLLTKDFETLLNTYEGCQAHEWKVLFRLAAVDLPQTLQAHGLKACLEFVQTTPTD